MVCPTTARCAEPETVSDLALCHCGSCQVEAHGTPLCKQVARGQGLDKSKATEFLSEDTMSSEMLTRSGHQVA